MESNIKIAGLEQVPAALQNFINDFYAFKDFVLSGGITPPAAPPPIEPRYITRKDAASRLHMSLNTLDTYARDGKLKAYRVGNRILFKDDELQEALKAI